MLGRSLHSNQHAIEPGTRAIFTIDVHYPARSFSFSSMKTTLHFCSQFLFEIRAGPGGIEFVLGGCGNDQPRPPPIIIAVAVVFFAFGLGG